MSRSRVLLILLLAAIVGGVLFLWGLRTTPPHTERLEEPEIALGRSIMTGYDQKGQRLWELEAQSTTLDEESNQTLAEHIRLRFFRDEQVSLEVTAARLLLFNNSQEMELTGGIEAYQAQGVKFYTEQMRWDPNRQVLVGQGEVEVQKGESRLTGQGFEYSPEKGQLKVREEAHLIVFPEGNDGPTD
jgi:LPS export ABC transporter protein LptC